MAASRFSSVRPTPWEGIGAVTVVSVALYIWPPVAGDEESVKEFTFLLIQVLHLSDPAALGNHVTQGK